MNANRPSDGHLELTFRRLCGGSIRKSALDDGVFRACRSWVAMHLGLPQATDPLLVKVWVECVLQSNHQLDGHEVDYLGYLLEVVDGAEGAGANSAERAIAAMGEAKGWKPSTIKEKLKRFANQKIPVAAAAALIAGQGVASDRQVDHDVLASGWLVFGYGSLLNPASLSGTIRRSVSPSDYVYADLLGYGLDWGVSSANWNLVDARVLRADRERQWAALVVQEGEASEQVDGAIFSVSSEELERLDEREARYIRVDVGEKIRLLHSRLGSRPVYTYVPKPSLDRAIEGETQCATASYVRLIKDARNRVGAVTHVPSIQEDAFINPDVLSINGVWERTNHLSKRQWRAKVDELLAKNNCYRTTIRNDVAPSLTRPLLVSDITLRAIAETAETALRDSSTAMASAMAENRVASYGVSSQEEDLASQVPDLEALATIARVDLVAPGGIPSVLEINSDSPAGLHHFSVLARVMHQWRGSLEGQSIDFMNAERAMQEAADAIIQRLPERQGTIAIVEKDPKVWPSWHEMEAFASTFERAPGVQAFVCEPHELTASSHGELLYQGHRVDVVYKRALWRDLQGDGSSPLLSAAKEGKVIVCNSFREKLAGNKRLLADLCAQPVKSGSRALVPATHVADVANSDLMNDVLTNPAEWVLKSFRGFGSYDVLAATRATTLPNWRAQVSETFKAEPTHIAQRRLSHTMFSMKTERMERAERRQAVFGAYLIDGRCVGVEAKVGPSMPISMNTGACRAVVGAL